MTNFKLGGEIKKTLLVPEVHLVLYGMAQTVLICIGEIISFLNKKNIKHDIVEQDEVAYDIEKFPPFFKKIKTQEFFQGKVIFDASWKSSGIVGAQIPAELNYLCPMEIKVETLTELRKTFSSLCLIEIAKSALDAISHKMKG